MNEAKHTKGPWTYTNRDGIAEVHGNAGDVLLWEDVEGGEEAHANARLISAAPRMYDRIVQLAESGDAEANSILEEINGTHGKS